MIRRLFFSLLFTVFLLPISVWAQSFGNEAEQSTLAFNPQFPEPGQRVTVSLDAYSLDLVGSSVSWFIDGTEQVAARNERSVEITAKALGETTSIAAQVRLRSGATTIVRRTLVPSYIDMIVEADTATPSGYQGRALGSIGAPMRVTAIPHFGGSLTARKLGYTWKLNNKVLFGGTLLGKQTAVFDMPSRIDSLLTVDITDQTGAIIGHKTIRLEPADPEVYFYEDNALRGLSHYAIDKELILLSNETTVQAVPFYMDLFDQEILHRWFINGVITENTDDDQTRITLQPVAAGTSRITYKIQSLSELLRRGDASFNLVVNSTQ